MSKNERRLASEPLEKLSGLTNPRKGVKNVLSINDNHWLVRDNRLLVDVSREHTWNCQASIVLITNQVS